MDSTEPFQPGPYKDDAITQQSDKSEQKKEVEPASSQLDHSGEEMVVTPRAPSPSMRNVQNEKVKKNKRHNNSMSCEATTVKVMVAQTPTRCRKSGSRETDVPVPTSGKKKQRGGLSQNEKISKGSGKKRKEELEREAYYLMKQIREQAREEKGITATTPQQFSPVNSENSLREARRASREVISRSRENTAAPRRRREFNGLIDLINDDGGQLAMEILMSKEDDSLVEESLDSGEGESAESDEIEVIETEENQKLTDMIRTTKLSRLGLRRPMWSSKFSSYFVILTFLLGYDTLLSFTVNFNKYGKSFVTAYYITLILVGFPLMYLELALGQFTSSNVLSIFQHMCPAFSGVGFLAMMLNFWTMLTDHKVIILFIQMIYHVANPLTNEMPWMNCISSDSDPQCLQLNYDCSQYTPTYKTKSIRHGEKLVEATSRYSHIGDICVTTPYDVIRTGGGSNFQEDFTTWYNMDSVSQYFFANTNLITLKTLSYPTLEYYVLMLSSWFVVYGFATRSSGNIVKLAKFAVILAITAVGILMYVLIGIRQPDYPYLNAILMDGPFFETTMWSDAIFLTLRSLKLGQGGLIFLGAQNRFHNNLFNDCMVILLVIAVVPYFYSLIHLVVIDSFAMKMAEGSMTEWHAADKSASESELFSSGSQAVHMVIFAQSIRNYGPYEPFVLFVFGLMCSVLILANKVIRVEIIYSAVIEQFPSMNTDIGRKTIVSILVALAIITMFLFASTAGFQMMVNMEHTVFPVTACLIVQLEIILVLFAYGARRLFANITFMVSKGESEGLSEKADQLIHAFVLLLWGTVIPLSLGAAVVTKLTHSMSIGSSFVPQVMLVAAVILVPAMGIVKISRKLRETGQFPWTLFRVDAELWGPRSNIDRIKAERAERGIRSFF